MDRELICLIMEILILENIMMENHMAKVNIPGVLVKTMLGIFSKARNMEKENGKVIKMQVIIISTMENIKMTRNMERVFSHGQVEIFTKEIMLKMSVMEMDKCYGQMAACMKENGKKVYSMV